MDRNSFRMVFPWFFPKPKVGGIYRLDQGGDPFQKQIFVKVLEIKEGYVQYSYCNAFGQITGMDLKSSSKVVTFKAIFLPFLTSVE
jgi:hypothetical protein